MICIIPARGGSKGLPNKNIKLVAGWPLLWYTITAAKKVFAASDIYVNTDSEDIAVYAKRLGVQVYMRSWELTEDYTSIEDVLKEQVASMKEDIIMYLQPTDIFRRELDMLDCLRNVEHNDYDSSFCANKTHKQFWEPTSNGVVRRTRGDYQPRQIAHHWLREDTGICLVTRAENILKGSRIGKHVRVVETDDSYTGLDIHDEQDIPLIEAAIEYSRVHKPKYYAFQ